MAVEFQDGNTRVGLLAAEEPPARRKTRGAKAAIKTLLPALREQRGTWFRVAEFPAKASASNYASQLRKEHQGYEWRSAGSESGSVLWARYVGGAK